MQVGSGLEGNVRRAGGPGRRLVGRTSARRLPRGRHPGRVTGRCTLVFVYGAGRGTRTLELGPGWAIAASSGAATLFAASFFLGFSLVRPATELARYAGWLAYPCLAQPAAMIPPAALRSHPTRVRPVGLARRRANHPPRPHGPRTEPAEPIPPIEYESAELDPHRLPERECSGIAVPDRGGFHHRIALTFDDGPDLRVTPKILAVLRRHRAPATFFISGEQAEQPGAAELLAEMAEDPLVSLGNHGYEHINLTGLSRAAFGEQIDRTNRVLERAGATPRYFRFPFGRATCDEVAEVRRRGMAVTGWHIDSLDWCFSDDEEGTCLRGRKGRMTVRERHNMLAYVRHQARTTTGGILLMHDTWTWSASQLDALLSHLAQDGFRFVRLEDPHFFPYLNRSPAMRLAKRLELGTVESARRILRGEFSDGWTAALPQGEHPTTLRWPVREGGLLAGYGRHRGVVHQAVDLAGAEGSEVLAAAPGLVAYAGHRILGYGNFILLLHPGGWVTGYAHNRANLVHAGEYVAQGQPIAELGHTGFGHDPHLHFELMVDSQLCDPLPLFRPAPVSRAGEPLQLELTSWQSNQAPVLCRPRRAGNRVRWALRQ